MQGRVVRRATLELDSAQKPLYVFKKKTSDPIEVAEAPHIKLHANPAKKGA